MKGKNIKAVFFDMDGILFDSMQYHSKAWQFAFRDVGIDISTYYVYLNEGRSGDETVDAVFMEKFGKKSDDETKRKIYELKTKYFCSYPKVEKIPNVMDVLQFLKGKGIELFIVTGSSQVALLDTIENNFPSIFAKDNIITAFDVKYSKPNPAPYLKALSKSGFREDEVIIVENAPLGIRSGVAAGIFCVGVNTGILKAEDLKNAGADIVFSDMNELKDFFERIIL